MSLRVRDSASAIQRRRHSNTLTEYFTTNRDLEKVHSVVDQPSPKDSETEQTFFSTGGQYVLSFTDSSRVTFVNVEKLRTSVLATSALPKASEFFPLDLTSKNHRKSIDRVDSFDSPLSDPDIGVETIFSTLRSPIPSRNSIDSFQILNTYSKLEPFIKSNPEMLSSRRHHSDESFSDRERKSTIDGKSNYPHSADAWIECRASPTQKTIEFSDSENDGRDSLPSNWDADFSENIKEKSQELPLDSENDDAINYSIRNSETKSPQNVENLKKAKRARVENIVTSIKDKPNRMAAEDSVFENSCPSEKFYAYKQFRKRKRGEQILELKKQLESLQKESEMEKVYDDSLESYDKEEESNPCPKRPRNDSDCETNPHSTPRKNSNGFYRGSVNFMIPQNGFRHPSSNVAYEVLCRSIKREIASALDKISENAAQKILEELSHSVSNKLESEDSENKLSYKDSNHKTSGVNRSSLGDDNGIDLMESNKQVKTSRYVADDKSERVLTSNQSQMCFGDMRVRRNENQKVARKTSRSTPCENEMWEETSPPKSNRGQSPENSRSSPEAHEIQTAALSLVKKKNSFSNYSKSSSPCEEKPFVLHREKDSISSRASTPEQEREDSFNYRHSTFSDARSRSDKSPLDTPPKSKFSHSSFIPDSSFFSQSSSAFRLPFRNDAIPPPNFRRDSFPSPGMLKAPSFSFGPSMYPSSAVQSQSVFPFSTGQLTFPLFQSIHQRNLASAIADYGRLRDGFEHGSTRSISTRTSTRDPPRTSGISRSLSGPKPDGLDFRSMSNDVSPYSTASIQEGLTPQHLKKAKLMFFYTRYPSANTLKTYFSDVKFSRATTSQLIKWFSNFREFYYIQMEKFARQALSDGVVDIKQLKVTRDCELFRVLNLHYNKSNDFRVPSEFLSTTLRTLQEFFLAIQKGKDQDPSWKKVIYKIICKLDQDIPDLFKLHNILERLDEI